MAEKYAGLKALRKLVEKIGEGVRDGKWLFVRAGRDANGNVVDGAVAEGTNTTASAFHAHAEGIATTASKDNAHAEGNATKATGENAHAEGYNTEASGACSHAEGNETKAIGIDSHAEGRYSQAQGVRSHAEGEKCYAVGITSHAEGSFTYAENENAHSEGRSTNAKGYASHVEGFKTIASGYYSHAEGCCNYDNPNFIRTLGVGDGNAGEGTNAEAVYVSRDRSFINPYDSKNGYKYLLGVGGYQGQEIGSAKSVQEVFADLTSRIEALEKRLGEAISNEEINTIVDENKQEEKE